MLGLLVSLCACCPYAGSRYGARSLPKARASDVQIASSDRRDAPSPMRVRVASTNLPSGRDIASLHPGECRRLLDRAGVRFESVPDDAAPHVAEPVYLLSPLEGVSFGPKNGASEHGMVDCRLAVALLAWAPSLQEAGVVKVEHYSTYRPGARVRASRRSSGHARALAIDAARFHMRDGTVLDVDLDWDERERGGDPCPVRRSEEEKGKLLRKIVCDAVERDLFQVVITPHHDRAHQNHVHLELVPEVDWSYVH
ncbi:MAG: extensin family protein [Myxococcales bacterium]